MHVNKAYCETTGLVHAAIAAGLSNIVSIIRIHRYINNDVFLPLFIGEMSLYKVTVILLDSLLSYNLNLSQSMQKPTLLSCSSSIYFYRTLLYIAIKISSNFLFLLYNRHCHF